VRLAPLALVCLAACFSPRYEPCTVACGPGDCPNGTSCGTDGYCHAEGEGLCPTPAPDADTTDAPPETPDATMAADASCRVALVSNGGFEAVTGAGPRGATGWFRDFLGSVDIFLMTGEGAPAFTAFEGSYGLRVGGSNNVDGYVYQDVGALPTNTIRVELNVRYRVFGTEDQAGRDRLNFALRNDGLTTNISLGGTIDGETQVPDWSTFQVQVPMATVPADELYLDIHFVTGTMLPTTFELDAIQLDAIVCQ
jgi:hypothetical protein